MYRNVRRITLTLLTLAWSSLACFAQADPVASEVANGQVHSHELTATALETNQIGDSPTKRVLVYTPPGYSGASTRFPTVYLLHGIFGAPEEWTQQHQLASRLDAAIASDRLPPVVVVMPHGSNWIGGGYYRDSPVSGNWGTFISRDLVTWIDAEYRTLSAREHRAIAGHSMGGYGAIHHAMENADVFSAAYAMSPCCLAPVEDLGQGNPTWQTLQNITELDTIRDALAGRTLSGLYTAALAGITMAFAEHAEAGALRTRLPFIVRNGETVPGPAYDDWAAAFPIHEVGENVEALRSLSGLAIDYGIDEQFGHIPVATRRFAQALAARRVPVRLEVYRGDHRNLIGARLFEVVLPFLLERIAPVND